MTEEAILIESSREGRSPTSVFSSLLVRYDEGLAASHPTKSRPKSQKIILPSFPAEIINLSSTVPCIIAFLEASQAKLKQGKQTTATGALCPPKSHPNLEASTNLRPSALSIRHDPSPRPAARYRPDGLHEREWTNGGLHNCDEFWVSSCGLMFTVYNARLQTQNIMRCATQIYMNLIMEIKRTLVSLHPTI
jgi:hypothetical protein